MPEPPSPSACRLPEVRLLRVGGADRAGFLQGQLTQDIGAVAPGRGAAYAWATAQGRVLACGQLAADAEAFWLTVPAPLAEAIARRLRLFVLRARVTVDVSDRVVVGVLDAPGALALAGLALPADALATAADHGALAARVPRDPARALWALEAATAEAALASAGLATAQAQAWRLADIRTGIPALGSATTDAFIPQMLNLDLLGGIAFAKGCYAGQEIVTRTRHLGRVKRRLLRFAADGLAPPAPGAPLYAAGHAAGTVVAAEATPGGTELLAVVALEELATGLCADAGGSVALRRLPLPYTVPGAGPETVPGAGPGA